MTRTFRKSRNKKKTGWLLFSSFGDIPEIGAAMTEWLEK